MIRYVRKAPRMTPFFFPATGDLSWRRRRLASVNLVGSKDGTRCRNVMVLIDDISDQNNAKQKQIRHRSTSSTAHK